MREANTVVKRFESPAQYMRMHVKTLEILHLKV